MKKVMVLGAGYTQIPLIRAAKRMGCGVAVVSIAGNYPAFAEGDVSIYADISSEEAVIEAARNYQPDGIATCGLDLAMRAIGAANEALGLHGPGYEAAQRSGNKWKMKEAFSRAGVQTAKWFRIGNEKELEEALKELSLPVMIKAVDLMGSRGIYRCDTREEALESYKKTMSETGKDYCLVEEYIEGKLFGAEGMVADGKLQFLLLNNTETFHSTTDTPIGHSIPFVEEEELREQVREQVEKGIRALGLDDCPINCDLINRNGKAYIVEMTGRSGATGLSEIVGTWFGIDYYEAIVAVALGEDVTHFFADPADVYSMVHVLGSDRSGILRRLENRNPGSEDILDLSFNAEPGDEIHAYSNGRDRIGQIILKGKSLEEMQRYMEQLKAGIYLELEGDISLSVTPVHLSVQGGENTLFFKREDLLPLSFGGNKVRFARSFLEDYEKKQASGMIVYGNYHSNLCRILSSACRQRGIACSMIHNVDDLETEKPSANSRMIHACGVKEFPCHKDGIAACVQKAREDMRKQGGEPYYIYGDNFGRGNAHTPMHSYVQAWQELLKQEQELGVYFDYIFVASSTNTTQSGLLAGWLLDKGYEAGKRKIIGISVSRGKKRACEVIRQNLEAYFTVHQIPVTPERREEIEKEILVEDALLAGGYGKRDRFIEETIRETYLSDGVYLDGTYTGKAFAGMKKYVEDHKLEGKHLLFLHTGGGPLFFDETEEIFEEITYE